MENPGYPIQPAIPGSLIGQRRGKEVVVEKSVEDSWETEERHSQTPEVPLGGVASNYCTDGRDEVWDLCVCVRVCVCVYVFM